ncbi:hypothetical protein WN943_017568 [Citrus x changshan-huyou]
MTGPVELWPTEEGLINSSSTMPIPRCIACHLHVSQSHSQSQILKRPVADSETLFYLFNLTLVILQLDFYDFWRSREAGFCYKEDVLNPNKKDLTKEKMPRNVPNVSSALFFTHNTALGPPYRVLVDTNFINFSIQNKLDLEKGMMDCLYAKCTPCITDCVMAELEKLGQKYRVALRIAKDPRFERLPCTHKGTYADDCLVERVTQHKCFIVATCDRDLKRRIRKVPGVPIMYITRHKYSIERLPEATVGGGMLKL